MEKRARQRTNMNGGQAELHGECGAMSKDSGTLESARVSEMGGDKGNLKKRRKGSELE